MSRFLSRRHLLHVGPLTGPTASRLRLLLQTLLPRPLTQTPAAATISGEGNADPSPTVSYLVHSCGLSPEDALSASKKLSLDTTDNPDAVLGLLRDHGCSPTQVAAIVSNFPALLRMRAAKTLEPKLAFLCDAGITGPRLAALLAARPKLLCNSLENKIAPNVDFLRRVLPPGAIADGLLVLNSLRPEAQLPNIETLRRRGVPSAGVLRLLLARPLILARPPARFAEIVASVEAMGLDPGKTIFSEAVRVMAYMSQEAWERKVALYRSLGWTQEEVLSAFVRHPSCLAVSDEGIRRKMEFFQGKLGLTPAELCRVPVILGLSLEKRIVPRCAVLKALMQRGLLKEKVPVATVLRTPEKRFLEGFVVRYRGEAPEVVDAHLGKVEFDGFGPFGAMARWVDTRVRRRR